MENMNGNPFPIIHFIKLYPLPANRKDGQTGNKGIY